MKNTSRTAKITAESNEAVGGSFLILAACSPLTFDINRPFDGFFNF